MRIFIVVLFIFLGCKDGPKVDVFVSDPARGGMSGVDKNERPIFVKYEHSENFLCFKPSDVETILNYCKLKASEK
jgi:hypothetical protein